MKVPTNPRLWKWAYTAGAVLCVLGGISALKPANTAGTNADWFLVAVAPLIGVLATVFAPPGASVWFAKRRGVIVIRPPSLDRHPFSWKSDPLQIIRVTVLSHVFWLGGAMCSLPQADPRGVMMFWTFAALTIGLYVGERILVRRLERMPP